MSKQDAQLQAIDPTALHTVTGGTVSSSGSSSDALTQALSSIVQSLSQLQNNRSQGGFTPETMMMFMMLMQQRNQGTAVAAAPSAYAWPQVPVGYY